MRQKRSSPKTMHRAGVQRKKPRPAEAKLWLHLRRSQLSGVSFRRQHAIGPFVVDFCSPKARLIIEVDGSPHLNLGETDAVRTSYLAGQGYRVLRFWDRRVMKEIDGVLRDIKDALGQ